MDDSIVESVLDDSAESDFSSPAPVTKAKPKPKAPAKAAAPKALKVPKAPKATASKKTTQTTLSLKEPKTKPASKKRPKPDSDDEDSAPDINALLDDSALSATPPSAKKQKKAPGPKKGAGKPLAELENDAALFDDDAGPSQRKGGKASDQYQKLTQYEHIMKRPDTYIGSTERIEKQMWVYNSELETMEFREISYVPGIYKIFDEIVVNAADNKQRDKTMDAIKITIDREKGEISVWNNGRGIPVEIHETEKVMIPEMIFGQLLTSSNYDDEELKITGGRNGFGAKLTNIFSTEFTVETADSHTHKKYKQTWKNNMSSMGKASITTNKDSDYTKVTFAPDFPKFGMEKIDDDFEALLKRRVYDLAGTSRGVKVWLNGEKLKISTFKKYMELYTKAIKRERGEEAKNDTSDIITDSPDPRWEIGFAVSDGTFQQVSFVNSIATFLGGTHVNYIADQVCNKLLEHVKKKNKAGAQLKLGQIRNHIFIFVNCLINNPAFTGQTKEQLTTKPGQFGSKCVVSDEFLKKVIKTDVVENILHFAEKKADQILKKSDGNKRSRMDNPKLTDANKAGTKDGYQCTLILTEGDSAKGLAMAGRSVVGPDLFGVFPLRGKLLNVRDASVDQISKNAEIQNIKNILGLKHKTEYQDCKSLRYGHIMIMTDQDHDGSHIKGLLINFLQVQYPSLLKIPRFLNEFITPIIKAYKGNPRQPTKWKTFFTMPEYEAWREAHRHERGWEHKYYKGLGTSSTEDAQVYFRDLDRHHKDFDVMQESESGLIELAFSKKKADERKEWLRQFKPGTYLDHSTEKITYTDFVNRELILFSMADNLRSIPSVVDGLKPGQRKVLYASFKKNLKKDLKVVELAGYVSGITAYQHGETSLQSTIIGLAQNFVGSNNINCLEPSGNFGSRLQGGSDAASPRYIYTRLSPFARRLFSPLDEPLLKYHTDDNKTIEPENYLPVVPLILINGADGIGTGWSTSIPNYNPEDIVENLRLMMDGQDPKPMIPWFRDFKGTVTQVASDRYKFSGIIKQTGDTEVEITELPIRTWTQDFKDKLVDIIKGEKITPWIKDYDDYNTHKDVNFVIRMEENQMKAAIDEGLEERFKLSKTLATSNLVAFDPEGRIMKYASVEDILKEFFAVRIKFYEKRKAHQLGELNKELEKFTNQARFIQMIIDGKLVVSKKKKKDLVAELRALKFKPIAKTVDASKEGETEPTVEDEDDEDDATTTDASSYDYLLGMAIWSLTKERIDKILAQIGDKEAEIDAIIKLSKEDLWKKDLDEFINEWRFQLAEEARLEKRVQNMGRRVSSKLRTQVKPARKRKGGNSSGSESDFVSSKPKKAPAPKSTLSKALSSSQPIKQTSITQAFKKPTEAPKAEPDPDVWMDVDNAIDLDSDVPVAPKAKAKTAAEPKKKAPAKAKKVVSEDEDDEPPTPVAKKVVASKSKAMKIESDGDDDDVARSAAPAATRAPRAVARKPIKYVGTSEDSDDDDDMLLDVGKMVKGIPGSSAKASSRPLFSATNGLSRPTSSAGFAARKSASGSKNPFGDDDDDLNDETDYALLAPANAKTAKSTVLSDDDEDSFDISLSKAPVSKTVAVPRARAGPKQPTSKPIVSKKPSAAPVAAVKEEKPVTLSPAAKAYAKKQLKTAEAKKVFDDFGDESDVAMEDVDKVVDDMLSDDDSVIPTSKPAAKPKGRVGSVQPKGSTRSVQPPKPLTKAAPKPAAKPAAKPAPKAPSRAPSVEPSARPARAAAKSKPKAFFSDEDEDEDVEDDDEATGFVSEEVELEEEGESFASAFSE